MGGGLAANDLNDEYVWDDTCELVTLVADYSLTDPAELPMVSDSSQEDGSVLEVNSELASQQKSTRTLVLVGRSGNGKSATGNSILGRQAFKSKYSAAGVTSVCELQSSTLRNGQILNVIDTPGLFSLSPSTEVAFKEILRCLSLTKEGIDAVVLVFSLRNRLTEEEKSALFALKSIFGSKIVDYMIVVFTNEDVLEDYGVTFEEYLDDSYDFKEILKSCNDRKVLFENMAKTSEIQKVKQIQELLSYVEEIVRKNGKLYMDDLSHDLEVETQLRETTERIEQQLNQEQAARLELEKRANEAEKHSSAIVQKLREDLEREENKENEIMFQENKIEAMKRLSSKQEISSLELEKKYKKLLKGVEEKVTSQLKESLRKQLSKAEASREEAEKKINEIHNLACDDIKKLREQLAKAVKETESLRAKLNEECTIL